MLSLLRWLVAGSLATVVTFALFIAMVRLVDGSSLLESLIWVFPLTQTELPASDDCADGPPLAAAVEIEGLVGHYEDGELGSEFHPLRDAEIVARDRFGRESAVEVSLSGAFRFVTAFPSDEPSRCELPNTSSQRLLIRARGCRERNVPITASWIPHRVLLDCSER